MLCTHTVNGLCLAGQHEHFRIFCICTQTLVVAMRFMSGSVWCLKLPQNMSQVWRLYIQSCLILLPDFYSLPRILLLVWFYLLFAIFQQVSDLVTSTGFLSTTEYSSKLPHSPIRPWQPVSHLISTISSNYTSHYEFSVLQPSNYSKYLICLRILVGTPSATALLQHGIP